jgi:hypothetical protein
MVEYAEVRLWADRVRLVKRYLASPGSWPGLHSKYGAWYQDRKAWWDGLAAHLDADGRWAGRIDDEAAFARWAGSDEVGRPKADGEPWVAAGVSRRTWYRQRQARKVLWGATEA